jgi:hypothetical protein
MIFNTLCERCQATITDLLSDAEIEAADTEAPLRMLDTFCQHNHVAINVMLIDGAVHNWSIYPARDEADFKQLCTNSALLLPHIIKDTLHIEKTYRQH